MYLLKLLIKNAFRHKLRTGLTILGITIAILAFGLLRTVVSAWYSGVEGSSSTRLITRNAVSLIFPLPISYRDRIRQVSGVTAVGSGDWFGGVYITEKNFFPNFAVDGKTYLDLYPEFILPPEQRKAFLADRKGCIAGRKVAEQFGWRIGDAIVLKGTIFPGKWEFTLRGIYRGAGKNTDETQFFFHWQYLNESLKKTAPQRADHAGFYVVGLRDPEQAAPISASIDLLFKNSLAETLTETEKAFQLSFVSMTDAIITVIQVVSVIIIVIIMAVMANTMAMTARERMSEYAVMKTLGFSAYHIGGLLFGESLVISAIGCAFGMALTFPAARWFSDAMGTYLPVFNVEPQTLAMDVLAAAIIGATAAAFPTWRAVTGSIAEGLRRIG
ncbi:MAG TPA: ABC transporter permease [Nitrospirota bacterium]|nr:ABC transporter permease [Nitrospirota bacterium]